MRITQLPTPAPGPAKPPLPHAPGQPPMPAEEVADVYGDKVSVFQFGDDGKLRPKEGLQAPRSDSRLSRLKEVFVPSNMPNSVSKDYLPTRGWQFVRDVFSNAAGSATAAGVLAVFGLNPGWALLQAPLNMAKDRFCQVVGFGSSFAAPLADRNPRAWMMAGETADHLGMILESSAALPGMFVPAFFGGPLVRILSGSMRGAASANIEVRQAVADNLGEVRAKNGNQAFISSLVGSVTGLAAAQYLSHHLGPVAYPLVTSVGAALSVASMAMMVKNLDYQPINESALRTIVAAVDREGQVPAPDRSVWQPVAGILQAEKLEIGQPIQGLTEDRARFRELKELYQGRNYLLEVKNGLPYVVLRENASAEDRFAAAAQAVRVENLLQTSDYQRLLSSEGPQAADRWLTEASLKKTPADPRPLLEQCKKAGWSADLIRIRDAGNRARWGSDAQQPFQYDLFAWGEAVK